jgi:hypothetical protein
MITRLLLVLALLLPSAALANGTLSGELRLKRLAPDLWEADYLLDEPVDAVHFGSAVVNYRQQAWEVLTPGLSLRRDDAGESITGARAFKRLKLRIRRYDDWSHDAYVPMDLHSDGGAAFYLGHLLGHAVFDDGSRRRLAPRIRLEALPGEHALLPEQANEGHRVYVYFGPQEPIDTGAARIILDPSAPGWLRDELTLATSGLSTTYAEALARNLPSPPLLLVGVSNLDAPGRSIKGGALAGQLFFKMQGQELREETPESRRSLEFLVAHELAHVWQMMVRRGGIGDGPAWVHEGGAEAMALAALGRSGRWDADRVARYAAGLREECRAVEARASSEPQWREAYACGFRRFDRTGIDALLFWKEMIDQSEAADRYYSPDLVDAVTARLH